MKSKSSNPIYTFASMQSEIPCRKHLAGLVAVAFKYSSIITEKVSNKFGRINFLITLSLSLTYARLITHVIYNLFTRAARDRTSICCSPCSYLFTR